MLRIPHCCWQEPFEAVLVPRHQTIKCIEKSYSTETAMATTMKWRMTCWTACWSNVMQHIWEKRRVTDTHTGKNNDRQAKVFSLSGISVQWSFGYGRLHILPFDKGGRLKYIVQNSNCGWLVLLWHNVSNRRRLCYFYSKRPYSKCHYAIGVWIIWTKITIL